MGSTDSPQKGYLQLVEKVVYVDMKALEEEAMVSCWDHQGWMRASMRRCLEHSSRHTITREPAEP